MPRRSWTRSNERRKDGKDVDVLFNRRGPNGRNAATLFRVARCRRAAQNGFLLFRNYRDVGSLGRHGGGGGGRGAAVGRKFKIEYLACNFHRSSKNHAVSYLAGGSAQPPTRLAASNRTNERRGEEKGKPKGGNRRAGRTAWNEKETTGRAALSSRRHPPKL